MAESVIEECYGSPAYKQLWTTIALSFHLLPLSQKKNAPVPYVIVAEKAFPLKVPLTSQLFFLFKNSTRFPDFISEKIISIDKILAFLQAFEHVISLFTTAQSGIWVGLLVTSLREPS